MALKVCCRLTRCFVRVLENRRGFFIGTPAMNSVCLQNSHVFGKQEHSHSWRGFCTASHPSKMVTYEEMKKLLVIGTGVVIDVREPWELREYGNIPGAINIPFKQVSDALQLKPKEFKEKYGSDMPSTTENIVFSCLAGMRSVKALEAALSLGYTNAQHYPGGWQDWAKHEILQTKE